MKKIARLLLLFSLLLVVFIPIKIWKYQQKQQRRQEKSKLLPILQSKPFVIVVPSYNNASFVEKNLHSIFTQNYSNYRVIYIDDFSTDETYAKAEEITARMNQQDRTLLVRNQQNFGALANLYNAIHLCNDEEIVVLVDGDDALAHENVLNKLDQIYSNPQVWMTYGNYLDYPSFKQNPKVCNKLKENVIRKNSFRKNPWVTTHLRTFYASLGKKIQIKDLIYRGRFFPMASDLALMFPLLEMAGKHISYVDEVLYLYNRMNPLSDHKINFSFQEECAQAIRNAHPYSPLKSLSEHPSTLIEKSDILIFSENHPVQLYALLESIERYVTDVNQIFVIYLPSNLTRSLYEEIKTFFPQVIFMRKDSKSYHPAYFANSSRHVLLASDEMIFKDKVSLNEASAILEDTQAFAVYFSHGIHLKGQPFPPLLPIRFSQNSNHLYGWLFSYGSGDWTQPPLIETTLLRREDLMKHLLGESASTKQTLGLFYAQSKSIKNSLVNKKNYTESALLLRFRQGYKIDLNHFHQMKNPSKNYEGDLAWIAR